MCACVPFVTDRNEHVTYIGRAVKQCVPYLHPIGQCGAQTLSTGASLRPRHLLGAHAIDERAPPTESAPQPHEHAKHVRPLHVLPTLPHQFTEHVQTEAPQQPSLVERRRPVHVVHVPQPVEFALFALQPFGASFRAQLLDALLLRLLVLHQLRTGSEPNTLMRDNRKCGLDK